ncbi:putative bifunctional P-450/NADPH-P450 reductase 2 (plasmid) [Rhodococcoides fascians]|uniref:Putative bifunctional P-450/NADPH-P450 reductase 2 n=1 Tax=Rhodococcoides fascians TaxID=1828 RepID=A0A143QTH1_RHOFA|nr:putative bifunctional P-450/NADPH-P450 reductase 2 [Rhodococcus fascians]
MAVDQRLPTWGTVWHGDRPHHLKDSASPALPTAICRRHRWPRYRQACSKRDGNGLCARGIYERKIFGHRLVVVSEPELVAEVNDEKYWAKFLALPHRKLRAIGEDGLFTAFNSEPNWHRAHAVLGPAFSKGAMRGYHEAMQESVNELLTSWDNGAGSGPVDAYDECSKLTFDVIGRCALSHDFGSFRQPVPFADAIARVLQYVNKSSNDVPIIRSVLGRRATRQHDEDLQFIRQTVDSLIEQRMSQPDSNKTAPDLLEHMLNTPDPHTGDKLTLENIRNQIITFLIAGNETTASTIAFALHFLSTRPDEMQRIRAEVDAVAPDGTDIEFENVPKLRRTRHVVDETLRLWPAAPGYFRKARERGATSLGGYEVPEGWVFVLLPQLHRSPEWGQRHTPSTPTGSPQARQATPTAASTSPGAPVCERVSAANSPYTRRCLRWRLSLVGTRFEQTPTTSSTCEKP